MEARHDGAIHVVRLDRGEPVLASLQAYVGAQGIEGGSILGLGAVRDAELGYFHPDERAYHRRRFPETRELLNLTGTISRLDGAPFVHAHVQLADENHVVVGGHLFEAVVAVTGEFVVHAAAVPSRRLADDDTGLKLLRFTR
jgi:uncharacterized protein